MDVWEQADLQTTLDAYLFIIGATFKETSFNFLLIQGVIEGFFKYPEVTGSGNILASRPRREGRYRTLTSIFLLKG